MLLLAFFIRILYNKSRTVHGRLAQLVALPLDVREVTGSSPVTATKKSTASKEAVLFYIKIKNKQN